MTVGGELIASHERLLRAARPAAVGVNEQTGIDGAAS